MQMVLQSDEGAKLIANAFDEFLVSEQEIPGPTKLKIAYFFEHTFKSMAGGQQ